MNVFADTSYFVALMAKRDQWSKIANDATLPDIHLVTSSAVVNETISLLQNRGFLSTALCFLAEIRSDPGVEVIHVDAALQSEAWDVFHRVAGSGANAVDCISFAIMKRRSIRRAFTFDEHFRHAGFEILR
jgi:predicted nucleic acid-binding protein